jgi:hypothetical protein
MSKDTEAFARQLAELSLSLTVLFDEHSEDNFPEVLPHIFLYDVVLHVVGLVQEIAYQNSSSARSELICILAMIELNFESGNPEIEELIAVSFLENLPMHAETGYEIREYLGPKLLCELRKIEW